MVFELHAAAENGNLTSVERLLANGADKINSPGNEYSPIVSPDGKYFFWTSSRSADQPLAKPLSYRELMLKLRSPQNGLGDIYQIDMSALGIEK